MAEPLVSVLVPIRNEVATIERCLDALLAQTYPTARTEILIVDGMSDDGTAALVRARAAAEPRLRVLDNPRRHAAAALNVGVAAARGEVIARVDGHALVPPAFLARCVDALRRRPDVDGVSGALVTRGRTPTGQAIARAMSSVAGVGTARFRTGTRAEREVDTIAFPVYRRAVVERLGPFDEQLVRNQDDEYNLRLTRAGGRLLLLPDVPVVYYCQGTLRGLWRQYFQYGFWKVRVIRKHRLPASWRHLVPGTLVALLAGLAGGALVVPAARPLALAAVGGYAVALAAAAMGLAWRTPALVPRVAAALATLHLAYGSGFWRGVVVFAVAPRARAGSAPRPSAASAAPR